MNSGQPPHPQKDSGEPFSWKLRPTLQLKIEANSSTENSRPTLGQLFNWKFRPTLEMIQTNPSPQESLGQPFNWKLRPTLQLKIKANSSTEN